MEFIILVGPVASGKSTLAEHYKRYMDTINVGETIILSSDALREELFGDINEQTRNQELFTELHRRIKQNIDTKNIIVDATNVTVRSRRSLLNCVKKKECHKVAIVMTTPIEECKERNAKRERVVPEWVIDKQVGQFEIPFFEEGFDDIVFDKLSQAQIANYRVGVPIEKDKLFAEMIGFNQKNSHHLYTLDEHCRRVALELVRPEWHRWDNKPFIRAAWLHDYGKLFTGTPKEDEEGNPTGDYKYYSHMNVGTYKLLSKIYQLGFNTLKEVLECLFYINYHMEPFFWREKETNRIKEKTQKKMIDRFGEDKYYNLLLFNLADRIGSGTDRDEVENDKRYLKSIWREREENGGVIKLQNKTTRYHANGKNKYPGKKRNIEIFTENPNKPKKFKRSASSDFNKRTNFEKAPKTDFESRGSSYTQKSQNEKFESKTKFGNFDKKKFESKKFDRLNKTPNKKFNENSKQIKNPRYNKQG